MTDDPKRDLLAMLEAMEIESVGIDSESEIVMAGGTSPYDPPYEEGPMRQHRPTGRVTITIIAHR